MSGTQLFALTLHRPWPALVAKGIKRIENRGWEPDRRLTRGQWFAIHAGKAYDDRCSAMAQRLGALDAIFGEPPANRAGHIVAVAQYGGAVTVSEDPWFFGPVGWILSRVVEIAPVPCRGMQKLWPVPAAVADQVRAAFRAAETKA